MSIGASNLNQNDIQRMTNVINDAWNKGTICIAAAGNEGTTICTPDAYGYPASVERAESIAACSVGEDLNTISLAHFSNENNRVDLTACGVQVVSTVIGDGYGIYSGTSMATPHVTAMAAVLAQYIKSKQPSLSGAEFSSSLVNMIHSNVVKVDGCGTKTLISIGSKKLLEKTDNLSIKTNELSPQYDNISFGLGYLRYEPNNGPIVPSGQKYFNNGMFLGYSLNS